MAARLRCAVCLPAAPNSDLPCTAALPLPAYCAQRSALAKLWRRFTLTPSTVPRYLSCLHRPHSAELHDPSLCASQGHGRVVGAMLAHSHPACQCKQLQRRWQWHPDPLCPVPFDAMFRSLARVLFI